MCVLVAQSCLTLCNRRDCSSPGSSVHGILQTRILEWVAISFPGDLPGPGMEPRFPALQVDSLPSEPLGKPLGNSPLIGNSWGPEFYKFRIFQVIKNMTHTHDSYVHLGLSPNQTHEHFCSKMHNDFFKWVKSK